MIRNSGKITTFFFLFSIIWIPVFSQIEKEEYKSFAASARKDVWDWKIKAFSNRKIPAEYEKYSTVVLARHMELQASAKTKRVLGLKSFIKDINFIRTFRELIKINDKNALENYSEISYTQFDQHSNASKMFYGVRQVDHYQFSKLNTVIGIRIIKPDGTIKEVDPDESVLTKDEKSGREAKLAIPGLQVGDILDYFIQVVEKMEAGLAYKDYLFELGDDVPILSYSMHASISKKYALEYRSMNGAPELKLTDDGEDFDVSLKKDQILEFPTTLWMSAMRQMPLARLRVVLGMKGIYAAKNSHKPGEVFKNIPQSEVVDDLKNIAAVYRWQSDEKAFAGIQGQIKTLLKSYNKTNDDLPRDSLPYYVYYAFRWLSFYNIDSKSEIVVGPERNQLEIADKSKFVFYLNEVMNLFKIDCDMIFVTSKYGPENNQVITTDDYDIILKTREGKPMYFTADGIFTTANFIPSYFEGQKAPTFFLEKSKRGARPVGEDGVLNLPYTNYNSNNHLEKLEVSFASSAMTDLAIKRTTSDKGHMKIADQKLLLLFEDYYEQERLKMGVKQSLREQLDERRKTKGLSEEYEQAFAKARKDWKNQFENEIRGQFDLIPKDLTNYKVNSFGIRHDDPVLEYSTSFALEGLVKKAGINYIVDIGKLIGSQLKLEEKQRTRTADVYMPFARSLDWDITLNVPDGYIVEGIDKLNIAVDNESAGFSSKATIQGNQLLLKISKSYKHAFDPAAAWLKLVSMLDAAQDFESAKILLKKKS